MEFQYIKDHYNVPAEIFREVIVDGKKGVITKDLGHHIGVTFYDKKDKSPLPCHPTWKVEYLESINQKPPVNKNWREKNKYKEFLSADSNLSFPEWLGIRK